MFCSCVHEMWISRGIIPSMFHVVLSSLYSTNEHECTCMVWGSVLQICCKPTLYLKLETGCAGAPVNRWLTDCENQITALTGSIPAK